MTDTHAEGAELPDGPGCSSGAGTSLVLERFNETDEIWPNSDSVLQDYRRAARQEISKYWCIEFKCSLDASLLETFLRQEVLSFHALGSLRGFVVTLYVIPANLGRVEYGRAHIVFTNPEPLEAVVNLLNCRESEPPFDVDEHVRVISNDFTIRKASAFTPSVVKRLLHDVKIVASMQYRMGIFKDSLFNPLDDCPKFPNWADQL